MIRRVKGLFRDFLVLVIGLLACISIIATGPSGSNEVPNAISTATTSSSNSDPSGGDTSPGTGNSTLPGSDVSSALANNQFDQAAFDQATFE